MEVVSRISMALPTAENEISVMEVNELHEALKGCSQKEMERYCVVSTATPLIKTQAKRFARRVARQARQDRYVLAGKIWDTLRGTVGVRTLTGDLIWADEVWGDFSPKALVAVALYRE